MKKTRTSDPHQQYLVKRITELKETHARLKLSERQCKDADMKLAYNSQAAGVWDTKCELEKVHEQYNGQQAKSISPHPKDHKVSSHQDSF